MRDDVAIAVAVFLVILLLMLALSILGYGRWGQYGGTAIHVADHAAATAQA